MQILLVKMLHKQLWCALSISNMRNACYVSIERTISAILRTFNLAYAGVLYYYYSFFIIFFYYFDLLLNAEKYHFCELVQPSMLLHHRFALECQ